MNYALRHPRRTLGLTRQAPAQAWLVLIGDPSLPSGRFGLSSAKVFTPRLSMQTWRGRQAVKRRVPLLNLFNRTPTPVTEGFSVRVTQVEDFRGKKLTYDSHNGIDFVIPPGTDVVSVANGRVVAVRNEYNRGGLKVFVDHGGGLMTTYHHLAEQCVNIGEDVRAGQVIAKSGYSGVDAIASFGAVPPHVHFNTLVGGVAVDAFARPGETSIWKCCENRPLATEAAVAPYVPTVFDPKAVLNLLDSMRDADRRDALAKYRGDTMRFGFELVIEAVTYPTRFENEEAARVLYQGEERAERMQLPFSIRDYDDSVFADDARFRYTLWK